MDVGKSAVVPSRLGLFAKILEMINIWLSIYNNIYHLKITFGNIQKLKICKQFLKGKSRHTELMEFGK